MHREEYLKYRNSNSFDYFYEYYKEHHKGGTFLDIGMFFQCMQMWPFFTQALENVTREYDVKFEIMSIQELKTGKIIKYL